MKADARFPMKNKASGNLCQYTLVSLLLWGKGKDS